MYFCLGISGVLDSTKSLTKLGALLKVCLLAWDIDVFWIIIWRANSKQPGKIRYCILVKIYIFSWDNIVFLCAISLLPEKKTLFFLSSRSSRPEVFCKNSVPRNFTKLAGKHLRQSLFFNNVAGLSLLLNSVFLNRGGFHFTCFMWISWNSLKKIFHSVSSPQDYLKCKIRIHFVTLYKYVFLIGKITPCCTNQHLEL